MRHNNKINHLGRTYSHRDAMLANMACSLIKHKRIFTTVPKAKELRKYVEPIITKSKEDTTHSRRMVFRSLQDKNVVTELFKDISLKIADRPGGYTRIIKTGHRLGDNASMCFIELVDYNENMLKTAKGGAKAAKTRRSRKKADDVELEVVAPVAEKATKTSKPSKTEVSKSEEVKATAPVVEAPIVEEQKEDTLPKENPTAE